MHGVALHVRQLFRVLFRFLAEYNIMIEPCMHVYIPWYIKVKYKASMKMNL